MMSTATANNAKLAAGMGQIIVGRQDDTLSSVLGSCLGVAIYHPRCKAAVLAHVVLAEKAGRSGPPGKFADTAIPEMISLLAAESILQPGLVAKVAGGSNMFGAPTGPMQIGDANAEAVKAALRDKKIRVVGEHLGGNKGRRVVFDCNTGVMTIEIVGQDPVTL